MPRRGRALAAGGLPVLAQKARGRAKARPLSPDGAADHLRDCIAFGQDHGLSPWEAEAFLVRWLAYGLGVGQSMDRPWNDGGGRAAYAAELYREFRLGQLQAADADVLGLLLSEGRAGGWNPTAFYPTPIEVCECMTQMVMHDVGNTGADGRDARLASVMDPCVGTGRFLLVASNHSVNLYGCDIDGLMVDACAVNLALYAPWGVYLTPRHRALLGRAAPTLAGDQRKVEAMDVARVASGHGSLPSEEVVLDGVTPEGTPLPHDGESVRVYQFDRHGQGDLFSVPDKEKGKNR